MCFSNPQGSRRSSIINVDEQPYCTITKSAAVVENPRKTDSTPRRCSPRAAYITEYATHETLPTHCDNVSKDHGNGTRNASNRAVNCSGAQSKTATGYDNVIGKYTIENKTKKSTSTNNQDHQTNTRVKSPSNSTFLASLLHDGKSGDYDNDGQHSGRYPRPCRSAGTRRPKTAVVRPQIKLCQSARSKDDSFKEDSSTTAAAHKVTSFAYRSSGTGVPPKALVYVEPRPKQRRGRSGRRSTKNTSAFILDDLFKNYVHVGDRVVVDVAKKKGDYLCIFDLVV